MKKKYGHSGGGEEKSQEHSSNPSLYSVNALRGLASMPLARAREFSDRCRSYGLWILVYVLSPNSV